MFIFLLLLYRHVILSSDILTPSLNLLAPTSPGSLSVRANDSICLCLRHSPPSRSTVARRRWCHKRRSSSRSPAAPSRSCDNSPQPGPCSDTAPPSRVAPAMMPSPAAPGRSATTGTTCPCGETARVVLETSKPPKKGRNANRTSKMVTSGPQCDVSHTSSSVQLHSITGRGRQ